MPAPQFVVNAYRFDPYKNYKFRIRWDGRVVAGVSKCSALKQTTEPVSYREGGDPSTVHLQPSTWKYEAITLDRGITHDPEFENWAKLVWNIDGDAAMSLRDFRKNITIELLNDQGVVVKAYNVFRCWVSSYQAMPELDAAGNAVAIEQLVIQNEGWARDLAVVEPTQS